MSSPLSVEALSCAVTTVHWQLRSSGDGPAQLPSWKGSLLRGALGWALRTVAEAAPAPAWAQVGPSFYDAVFEPQRAWGSPRAVPLWGLVCRDRRRSLQPGDTLDGALHLVGDWPDWTIAIWQEAFHIAAHTGLGEGRHRCDLHAWQVNTHQPPTPPPAIEAISSVELHTITPCRLQEAHHDLRTLEPSTIARALVRRLRAIHIQTRDTDPFADGLGSWYFDHATDLQACAGETRRIALERHSARQGRKHPMPTLAGWVRITCDHWQPWAPLFALAPWLHIGRQPNFGLGAVDVRWQLTDNSRSETATTSLSNDMPALETP